MRTQSMSFLVNFVLLWALPALAADWPQWRGPDRTDISRETGLLKRWPKAGPSLLWTYEEAGVGYSAPALVGDRLYLMGGDDQKEDIYALDIRSKPPKKLWSVEVGSLFK